MVLCSGQQVGLATPATEKAVGLFAFTQSKVRYPFGKAHGAMMVVGFLMGHLLYGAIVGWIYTVPGS
jgi:hypothetical protein